MGAHQQTMSAASPTPTTPHAAARPPRPSSGLPTLAPSVPVRASSGAPAAPSGAHSGAGSVAASAHAAGKSSVSAGTVSA